MLRAPLWHHPKSPEYLCPHLSLYPGTGRQLLPQWGGQQTELLLFEVYKGQVTCVPKLPYILLPVCVFLKGGGCWFSKWLQESKHNKMGGRGRGGFFSLTLSLLIIVERYCIYKAWTSYIKIEIGALYRTASTLRKMTTSTVMTGSWNHKKLNRLAHFLLPSGVA